MNCPHCGGASFRTSRFRLSDIPRLLLFQFPVRCRSCRERGYAGLLLAMNLRQAGRIRHIEERAAKSTERLRNQPR